MDILYQENVIWAILALFCSALVLTLWGIFGKFSYMDSDEIEKKFTAVSEEFLSKIPNEWVFIQELEDIIFGYLVDGHVAYKKEGVQAIDLTFLYEARDFKPNFSALVERILGPLEASGRIERSLIVYSRENLQNNPEFFDSLPDWLRTGCEASLLLSTSYSSGEKLVRIRKTSFEKNLREKMMKDIGMDTRASVQSLK